MEDPIKISLVTTLYNEANTIVNFLQSYKDQTKHADEFIIVDGDSTDGTIELINEFIKNHKYLNVKLIIDKTCSRKYVDGPIAKGRNIAIKNAKYEYIAVTDAGCILDTEWFEEITKPFKYENIDVVSGWYEANITNEFQKNYAEIFMPKLNNMNKDTFLPSSRSIAFKKSCWEKVEGYPEETLTAEDTLFDINLKRLQCKFYFAQNAIVYWNCPASYDELVQKSYYYAVGDGENRLYFWKFLLRNFLLLFPINIIFSKHKRKFFKVLYASMFSYQKGYLKGFLR
jgi:glycosyltransferase involved in cell wall biosynthesis